MGSYTQTSRHSFHQRATTVHAGGARLAVFLVLAISAAWAAEGPFEVQVEKDVMVPMRDGVHLACDVYLPARDGKVLDQKLPTIL
jgi:predicted acyl esterase